jgi:glutamate-1-semialdehyde 2,1-aminomutase
MKVVAIVQARMGSTRLPGKVMRKISGQRLIEILLYRLSQADRIDKIVIATSNSKENDSLVDFVEKLGYDTYRGSESDVLDRIYKTATNYNADVIVRITGDCPLVDPKLVDEMLLKYHEKKCDFLWNDNPPTYPDGLDVDIFNFNSLELAWENATSTKDREHVVYYMTDSKKFNVLTHVYEKDYSNERWTVDEKEDLAVIENVISYFSPSLDFSWNEVISLKEKRADLFEENINILRNEGVIMGSGQKLWKRAKNIIPGGNMLLSKRTEMFIPDKWPAYFSKSKGCYVWDLDNNKYTDMSIMGVGTNTLGYGNPEVDDAVRSVIDNGNMSTFNCPEEVYLAEKLVELHPWSDMVRFARTGGEANAIAVRIARAASGKEKVAVCGYHGWQDWYLAANLKDNKALDGHLLPGLEPNGVPRELKGSVITFNYNKFDQLKKIVEENDIGVIMMEVLHSEEPKDDFLHKIRDIATKKNIILIFDEISSGFRQTFGGIHKLFNIEPDMAVFGKALGNGYPITAVIGKRDIMDEAQSTFISSTFWTDRVGPTAALKTLEVMDREKSWEKITEIGRHVQESWKIQGIKHDLDISVGGIPAISTFSFNNNNSLKYKTYLTQEMLKRGYLSSNLLFSCIAHNESIIDEYLRELDELLKVLSKCHHGENNIDDLLDGQICHSGFKRLN